MIRQAQLRPTLDIRPLRNAILIAAALALSTFAGTSARSLAPVDHSPICKCAHCPGGAACCCHDSACKAR